MPTEFPAIEQHRARGERIVFTNGCFDILHVGHAVYLAEARALGDVLVVGLNSDSSVVKLKGPSRPIVPQAERKAMLEALRVVDHVITFDEETPFELIQVVRPDVLVKGGDWKPEQIIGHDIVASYGGETRALQFVAGHSTTNIIEKIAKGSK